MPAGPAGSGDLEFLQAFVKRGFVNIPRMLFDYMGDMELDYDTIGKIFILLACVGGPGDLPFTNYTISRRAMPGDFDQIRSLLPHLEQKAIIRCEQITDNEVTFSLVPVLMRFRASWGHYRNQHEADGATDAVHPAIKAAERLLVNMSERAVEDIKDWIESYGFDTDMVVAVIEEGRDRGITRRNYLNEIARRWYEEGIKTRQEAKEFSQNYQKWFGKHKTIIQYLGIKRPLTRAERDLLEKWTDEWGFSTEVVIRACGEATGAQNPLQYVNGILESWQAHGVRSVAEADQLGVEHKRRTAPTDSAKVAPGRKSPARSNVILQRDQKDDSYYDYIYKKFGK